MSSSMRSPRITLPAPVRIGKTARAKHLEMMCVEKTVPYEVVGDFVRTADVKVELVLDDYVVAIPALAAAVVAAAAEGVPFLELAEGVIEKILNLGLQPQAILTTVRADVEGTVVTTISSYEKIIPEDTSEFSVP